MTARKAAARHPAPGPPAPRRTLHGARGLAERCGRSSPRWPTRRWAHPPRGPSGTGCARLLGAAGSVLDAAARAVRHGDPLSLDETALGGQLKYPRHRRHAHRARPPRRRPARLAARPTSSRPPTAGRSTTAPDAHPQAAARADAVRAEATRATLARTQEPGAAGEPPAPGAHAAPSGPDAPPRPVAPAEPPVAAPVMHRPGLVGLVPVVARSMREELRGDRPSSGTPSGYRGRRGGLSPRRGAAVRPRLLGTVAAVMVMRPEFTQTYSRAVARFGGTLVGVSLATGIVQAAEPERASSPRCSPWSAPG